MRDITRRAWNGDLKNIDNLMSWLYDQEILNKGDREKKDSIFRQYYRYYNDGDAPRGVLRKYGVSMYQKTLVEQKLESYLNEYISTMLKKYAGKFDRQDFYIDRKISNAKTVARITADFEVHGLVTYWKKDVENKMALILIDRLSDKYDALHEKVVAVNAGYDNTTFTCLFDGTGFSKAKKFNKELKADWREIKEDMLEIANVIEKDIVDLRTKKARRALRG